LLLLQSLLTLSLLLPVTAATVTAATITVATSTAAAAATVAAATVAAATVNCCHYHCCWFQLQLLLLLMQILYLQKNSSGFDKVISSHYFEFNPSPPDWKNFDISSCVAEDKRIFLKFSLDGKSTDSIAIPLLIHC
jgi:hypothetical protein